MYLSRVEVAGFKSFPRRTVLEFEPHITVLVGPNGSGKSNLVDAVRWALGEQRPSATRVRRAEDVIFAGLGSRHPLGVAEVVLCLDNCDGRLEVEFSELAICRRLYRSGDSECYLNRRRVRLKDVADLVLRAGLGPESYCVVGQGTIEQLVAQRPEERRILLENAADIRRHRAKVEEARAKTAETEQNLCRCKDLLDELEPQVRVFEKQARESRRYRQLAAELATLELLVHEQRVDRARRQAAETEELLTQAEEQVGQAESRLRTAAEEAEAWGRKLGALEADKAATGTHLAEVRERASQRAAALQTLSARMSWISARMEQCLSEKARWGEESGRFAQERLVLEQSRTTYEGAVLALAKEAQRAGERLAELQGKLGEGEKAWHAPSEASRAKISLCGQCERDAATARARSDAVMAALGETEVRLASLQGVQEETARQAQEEEAALVQARAALERTEHREQQLRTEVAAAGQAAEALARRHERTDRRLHQVLAARDALDAAIEAVSGLTMRNVVAGSAGVVGTLIEVPDRFREAVGAALDGAAGYVVVDTLERAVSAAGAAQAESWPRTAFSPLRVEDDGAWDEALRSFRLACRDALAGMEIVGFGDELARTEKSYSSLVQRYLGLAVVVEDLASALEADRRLRQTVPPATRYQVVTLDGRAVRPTGEILAGREGQRSESLGYRHRRRVLDSEARLAEALVSRVRSRWEVSREKCRRLVEEQGRAAIEVAKLSTSVMRQEAALANLVAEAERRKLECDVLQERCVGLHREAEEAVDKASRADELAARARKDAARAALAAEKKGREVQDVRRLVEEARENLAALRERLARSSAEATAVQTLLARATQTQAGASEAQVAAAREAESLEGELEALRVQVAALAEETEAARREEETIRTQQGRCATMIAEAQKTLARCLALQGDCQRELAQAEGCRREQRRVLERAKDELTYMLDRAGELEQAWDVAARGAWSEEPGRGLAPRSSARLDVKQDQLSDTDVAQEGALQRRIAVLRKELRGLAGPSPAAEESYARLNERCRFLKEQIADLEAARRRLQDAMRELEGIVSREFVTTLGEVEAAFQRCIALLFGGGTAGLGMSDPGNPLNTGVEMTVRLPGKRAHGPMSMSGGERALAGIAFLFALLEVNPSPFCLLDEVDAALDEANVQRFARLLVELSSKMQFIVVTHNRATMEVASAIYGVSLDESKGSRVVSLRL